MSFHAEDPKWTAYVLDELDAAERANVEQELAASAEARQFVEELRSTMRLLTAELKSEPVHALSAEQHAAIHEQAQPKVMLPEQRSFVRRRWAEISVVAASVLLLAGLIWPQMHRARETARRSSALNNMQQIDSAALQYESNASDRDSEVAAVAGGSSSKDDLGDQPVEFTESPQEGDKYGSIPMGGKGPGRLGSGDSKPRVKTKATGGVYPIAEPVYEDGSSGVIGGGVGGDQKSNKYGDERARNERGQLEPWSSVDHGAIPFDERSATAIPAPGMGGGQKSDRFGGPPAKESAPYDDTPPASEPGPDEYADERGRLKSNISEKQQAGGAQDSDVFEDSLIETEFMGGVGRKRLTAQMPDSRPGNFDKDTQNFDAAVTKKNNSGANREQASEKTRQTYGYNAPRGKRWPGQESGQGGEGDKTTDSLQMSVTPRIIIQDEEEERLGLPQAGWAFKRGEGGGEAYDTVTDNPFHPAKQNPLSTFSIDVDTASYSNIRRFLTQNRVLPPPGAVRIEEMINYFRYDYPQPEGDVPFSVTTEVAGCPWNAGHRLVRVGLKGREIDAKNRPASNLVFLLDVSGSMSDANKLPLVREAMKLLVEQLSENDRVAIVVYAGNSGLVLPSITGDKQRKIREAIDRLEAGGSTNGAGGIQQAYEVASQNFIKGGTNRVILATDGDFNVGITDREQLVKLITEQAKSGVFLTTLGFGMGNLKDGTLEQLADKGNGNYAYIDDLREAKKVFVEQMQGTLITIAKDVKIQIEFNPAEVASYRLIGYENRIMAHEDFNDDKKDAGEIGAGHTVTALYEIAPAAGAAAEEARPAVDQLKYQPQPEAAPVKNGAKPGELLTLKLRYKQPDGDTSKLIESVLTDSGQPYGKATADFKFASAVALFGMTLRDSPHKGTGTIDGAIELGLEGLSKDDGGYRTEFVELVKAAKAIAGK